MRKDRAYRKGRIMRCAQNAIDEGVLYVRRGGLTQREARDFRKDFLSLNGYWYRHFFARGLHGLRVLFFEV